MQLDCRVARSGTPAFESIGPGRLTRCQAHVHKRWGCSPGGGRVGVGAATVRQHGPHVGQHAAAEAAAYTSTQAVRSIDRIARRPSETAAGAAAATRRAR